MTVLDHVRIEQLLKKHIKESLALDLRQRSEARLSPQSHGDLPGWIQAINAMPKLVAKDYDLAAPIPKIGQPNELKKEQREALEKGLKDLMPWRKGPFNLYGVEIDAEWRSDKKWARLEKHIEWEKARVLDVGCGDGYYCLRAVGAGARLALGVDPTIQYVAQFAAISRFIPDAPAVVLPLGLQDLSTNLSNFDVVLSMGVLYHRRSPLDHLMELKRHVKVGGTVVVETLVAEGPEGYALVPDDRYAEMPNVWFIPAPDTVKRWLTRCGFKAAKVVDVTATSVEEQRTTSWMPAKSLKDFLNPSDPSKTVEGYPAPRRAIVLAKR
jgi:tRNA (mo5U34)-methyltransferase